jgi:hypothetical protein
MIAAMHKQRKSKLILEIHNATVGLPSQLRDDVMAYAESSDKTSTKIHESDVTRDYKMQEFLRDPSLGASSRIEAGDKMLKIIRAASDQRHQNLPLSTRPQVMTKEIR